MIYLLLNLGKKTRPFKGVMNCPPGDQWSPFLISPYEFRFHPLLSGIIKV